MPIHRGRDSGQSVTCEKTTCVIHLTMSALWWFSSSHNLAMAFVLARRSHGETEAGARVAIYFKTVVFYLFRSADALPNSGQAMWRMGPYIGPVAALSPKSLEIQDWVRSCETSPCRWRLVSWWE